MKAGGSLNDASSIQQASRQEVRSDIFQENRHCISILKLHVATEVKKLQGRSQVLQNTLFFWPQI
jgi:hypothetical protein